jgi:hypothetical protein
MNSFNIPWKCLDLSTHPKTPIIEPPKPQKTFAQALTNLCDIPLSQFPQPVLKGERLAIEIPETAYEAGLVACKHNLHGRILWPKGSTPLSVGALKEKLAQIWKDLSRWGVISLGMGFFEFTFSTLKDVKRVRTSPSSNLNPGLLKLFAWTRDFNPKLQHNTSVQVWVKIFGLSQEYWHKNILFTIAGSIGTPICMDSASAKPMHERTFGQFVRILVDIDLLQPLRHKLLVERKGFAFFVDLEYEHIPAFCDGCKVIGHNFENCKRWNKEDDMRIDRENNVKKKAPTQPRQVFVPVSKNKPAELDNVEKEIINVEDTSSKTLQASVEVGNKKDCGSTSKTIQVPSPVSPKSLLREQDILLENDLNVNLGETNINQALPVNPSEIRHLNDETVLSPVSPRSLLIAQEKQLANDMNEVSDDDTGSQTSFVNESQNVVVVRQAVASGKSPMESSSQPLFVAVTNTAVQIPDRVEKDMVFLKESWANMADAEEQLQKNLEDTGQHNLDDGFQVQLSKGQKRIQKKLKQSSRDSYATRSKGVSPKPFR